MCVVQELRATDYEQREDFAIRMQVLLEEYENTIIIMSDEAHFHLSGEVNKQNLRYWASENSLNTHEKPLHSERVTVWSAFGIFGIIGPYNIFVNMKMVPLCQSTLNVTFTCLTTLSCVHK